MRKLINTFQKCIIAIMFFLAGQMAVAANPSSNEILQSDVNLLINEINNKGHPIFISNCRTADNQIITLVIASNEVDGLQVALKQGVITSLAEITPSSTDDSFLIEADGGVYSQRIAYRIFSVMKKLSFHLVNKITLSDLLKPVYRSKCAIRSLGR